MKISVPALGSILVQSSHEAFAWFADLAEEEQEVVRVVSLNSAHEVLATRDVFRGTLVDSPARPREILRAVLLVNGAAFVLGHNHPSGHTSPSDSDAATTVRLKWAADLIGLRFIDHLIIAGGRESDKYFSFADAGLLNRPFARAASSLRRSSRRSGYRRSDGPNLS